MPPLHPFFAWEVDPGLLLSGQFNPWLVALSVAVAVFSSSMALQAAWQAREADDRAARMLLAAGSVSLGGGVWAMHFVGMLAFELCLPVRYAAGPTLLSILPAIAASRVALGLLRREDISRAQLVVGGALVGGGIGTMHYLGMAAMEMSAVLRYDPWMFGVSLVVAVGLAILALWVRFGLNRHLRVSHLTSTLLAGCTMGLAMAGMHYTGMAAARFIGERPAVDGLALVNPLPMALGVALVTVVGTGLVAAAAGLMRYRDLLEALQHSTGELRAVFATGLDGMVVVDARGTIADFNVAAEKIFGVTRDEVVGRSCVALMPESMRAQALENFGVFAQGFADGREYLMKVPRRTGGMVPVRVVVRQAEVNGRLVYVSSFSDVSERVEMEKALRHSEQRLRSLIGNLPGLTFRVRPEPGWPLDFLSDAALNLTGYPAADFIGESPRIRFAELVTADDAARITHEVRRAIDLGQPFQVEFQLRHRDGSTRWMWSHGRAVRDDNDDGILWVDGVILDFTDRHEMEEALRSAKARAEEAVQIRSAILANMSHEIRTPMNAILGFTDVVLGGELSADARQHLQTVRNAARSLLVLLNDILDTSKLERGAVVLESLPYDLPELLHQVVEEQRLQARKKGLNLSLDFDPTIPAVVMGDGHRLKQVLLNLVGNAVKFTEHGSVTLRARRDGAYLTLAVRDTGIGIAPDRVNHIFDAFTQADASMSRRYGGTGLGTTISRQLVDLMGGTIDVESTLGVGTTFTVRLPLHAAPMGTLPAMVTQAPTALPPMHVLVGDDVPENRSLLSVLLARHGHTVTEADNGLTALACCDQTRFDLILMDLQMPELDGFEATRRLRERETLLGLSRTPVVALSASVFQEDRQNAADAGMDGFAFKPVELDALMREVARVTGHTALALHAHSAVYDGADPEGAGAGGDATLLPLVDMEAGLRRWGDAKALAHALSQFGEAKRTWLAEQNPQSPPEADAAENAGHRLKGVAANLGLPALQAAAAQLERDARAAVGSEGQAGWHPAWMALLGVLRETLLAVYYSAGEEEALSTDVGTGALRTPDSAEAERLLSLLRQLHDGFGRGDRLDVVLERLPQEAQGIWHPDDLKRLIQAVDDFDFDAAQTQVDHLRDDLTARLQAA